MRWLKHMTSTRDDEKVAALIEAAGAEGYGLWWMVLETIASSMEGSSPKCSLSYPLSKWAAELQQTPNNLRRKLAAIVAAGLLELRWDGAKLELGAPNLLKYRDEYSKKSGQTPESVRSKIQIQIQNTEADTKTDAQPPKPPAPTGADAGALRPHVPAKAKGRTLEDVRASLGIRLPWFEYFCSVHPAGKEGVKAAAEAFARKVSADEAGHQLAIDMYHGAKLYAERCAMDPTSRVKWMQGWINDERWRDIHSVAQPAPMPTASERRRAEVVHGLEVIDRLKGRA